MDLSLTDTQQMIRAASAEFMAEHAKSDYVREMESHESGCSDHLWRLMADLGWTGMLLPERRGGSGLSMLEMSVLMEEMGAAAFPGPFLQTAVTGAVAISEYGNDRQKAEYLPALASGGLITSLAFLEEDASWGVESVRATATRAESGWSLNGTKRFVPGARCADLFIFAAITAEGGSEGHRLFLVDRSALSDDAITPLKSVSDDRFCEVRFDGAIVPPDSVLGGFGEGSDPLQRIIDVSTAAQCAAMLGGSRRAVEMTVDYVKERSQFGRAIGSFQAVQHRVADMATDLEVARQFTYRAIWKIAEGREYRRDLAVAKAFLSEKFSEICYGAHQMHGAIGFTQEHDLQIYSRRAAAARVMFGDANHHRAMLAEEMGL